mmetsp:Transcript_11997/g.34369  ORF Transcript_11997/g.34369 Transcript_11997/m.34369 type:complete len:435 (-) Transcript_11997:317-1621(-)
MALGPVTIVGAGLYMLGSVFFLYYFVLSVPSDSETAYFVQVTLPKACSNRTRRIFGDRFMQVFDHVSGRALVLVYFTIVGGCWSIVFTNLYPWLLFESPGVSNVHAVIGVLVFFACFTAWAVANASHPGMITARSFRRYDHFPYDELLFQSNTRCETTKLLKMPRCKFDRMKYGGLVPRYDHYCGWTNNTYGEENYRWFLLFLLEHIIMCFYGTYVSCLLFLDEIRMKRLMDLTFFDRLTGEKEEASFSIVFQYMLARRTREVGVTLVMLLMGLALTCFFSYHVYITSMGQTTNENGKWGDIKQWYKKQQKVYQAAVREGKVGLASGKNDEREQTDQNADKDSEEKDEQDLSDPGPIPTNLYNRGFVENWKEVFFPLSLRKDALARGGYTRALIQQRKQQQEASQETEKCGNSICSTECSATGPPIRSTKPKDI